MTFTKHSRDYLMVSDEDDAILKLIRSDRDGVRHFRIESRTYCINFEAVLHLGSSPVWRVVRIVVKMQPAGDYILNPSSTAEIPTIFETIHQALLDFGFFFGDGSGKVGVSIECNLIHSSN